MIESQDASHKYEVFTKGFIFLFLGVYIVLLVLGVLVWLFVFEPKYNAHFLSNP